MKRITAILLIAIMSAQCFYKLGVITYFQLHKEYIAEILCINKEEPMTMCYGQCFLKKNLTLADDAAKTQGTAPSSTERFDFPFFLIAETKYSFCTIIKRETINSPYIPGSSSDHITPPFHPPSQV